MFFVVLIDFQDEKTDKKIFYIDLTPLKLKKIIKDANEQKTITVTLYTFPVKNDDKVALFSMLYENCRKQSSYIYTTDLSLKDAVLLQEQGEIKAIFPLMAKGKTIYDTADSFLKFGTHIYAKTKLNDDKPIDYDLGKSLKIAKIDIPIPITVKGKVYYDTFSTYDTNKPDEFGFSGKLIYVGNSFTTSKHDEGIRFSDNLRERSKDIEFLLAVVEARQFEMGERVVEYDLQNIYCLDDSVIEGWKNHLEFCQKAVELLDLLRIEGDISFSKLDENDFSNICRLIKGLVEKCEVSDLISPDIDNNFAITPFCDYHILLYYTPCNDNRDFYTVRDFFSIEMNEKLLVKTALNGIVEKTVYEIYPTLNDNNSGLTSLANLRFENLLTAYELCESNEEIYKNANSLLYELLRSFDNSNDATRKNMLLATALSFSEWLLKTPDYNKANAELCYLNFFNIVYRVRDFTDEEKKILWEIAENDTIDKKCRGMAHLLLGNQTAASLHFGWS